MGVFGKGAAPAYRLVVLDIAPDADPRSIVDRLRQGQSDGGWESSEGCVQAADGGDVAVQDVDARDVAGLDLRDAADGDAYGGGDVALSESLALADLGQAVGADLGEQGVLAGLYGLGPGRRDVLCRESRTTDCGSLWGLLFGSLFQIDRVKIFGPYVQVES